MKNLTYILMGISGFVMVLMTASWAQNPPPAIGAKQAPVAAPAVTPVPVKPAATAPAAAAPAGGITMPATATPPPPQMTTQETVAEMKKSIETGFADVLSFPLNESKMLAFVRAAIKVEKVNSKWDVQIASAETDQMAIEYNNFAVEEINNTLKTLDGITFPEYQEMTKLTVDNKDFNKIYLAYKQLIQEKYFGEAPKPATPATPAPAASVPPAKAAVPAPVAAKPATTPTAVPAAPAAAVKPPAVSSNPGIVPAPQGSPVPPYSKP